MRMIIVLASAWTCVGDAERKNDQKPKDRCDSSRVPLHKCGRLKVATEDGVPN